MKSLAVFTIFVFTLLAPVASWTESVYVKPIRTKIYSRPSGSSMTVTIVKKNQPLKVLSKKGGYYMVKTSKGKVGYISTSFVFQKGKSAKIQPAQELGSLLGALGGDRTIAVTEGSSSHSIRGLKKAKNTGPKMNPKQAEKYVESMEEFSVSNFELSQFQRDGGVGVHGK